MDHAGAVAGPLVAAGLMSVAGFSLRHMFLLAAVPAVVVVGVLLTVREPPARHRNAEPMSILTGWRELGPGYQSLLLALAVFTLGNSTDAFLLLRLNDAGIAGGQVALLWSLHHVVKMVSTYLGGRLSDRFGRRTMVMAGWMLYAAVYAAFALVHSPGGLVAVFLAYGLYFGMTEPAERAWIADLVPERLRGTAFGCYHGLVGLAALPASLFFGVIWHAIGTAAAFAMGACLAMAAAVLVTRTPQRCDRAHGARAEPDR